MNHDNGHENDDEDNDEDNDEDDDEDNDEDNDVDTLFNDLELDSTSGAWPQLHRGCLQTISFFP